MSTSLKNVHCIHKTCFATFLLLWCVPYRGEFSVFSSVGRVNLEDCSEPGETFMFCCTLLYVLSSIAIILMGKRELVALLNLSTWCLVMVERLFLAVPQGCLRFVIVVFPDHTHLLFLMSRLLCLCCEVTVKSFPVLAFNVVIITIVRIYT